MDKSANRKLEHLIIKPMQVFLIDGLGALMSAAILIIVFWESNARVGMPLQVIQLLAFLAICFSVFSLSCFFFLQNFKAEFLKIIVIGNFLYCLLTAGLVISFYPKLSVIELIYFSVEVIIICGIIYLELQTLKVNSAAAVAK